MNKPSLLLLLGLAAHRAVGFAPHSPFTSACVRDSTTIRQPSGGLRDSLFDEIFERDVLPPTDYNDDAPPFSEYESPQGRARRMEMARELQKAFYKEPDAPSSTPPLSLPTPAPQPQASTSGSKGLPYGATVLRDLPTLTTRDGIKNADESAILPGYQFVWNVHSPQHCHMFHSILAGPAPWHFAHVYLPPSPASSASKSSSGDDDESKPIDNVESYNAIHDRLRSRSNSPLYGTLLRITDRRFRDEDGSIVLAVQAVDRLRIHDVASAPGTYLRTDVQISPEEELMRACFDEALMSSASYLSYLSGGDAANEAPSCGPSAVSGAARAAATADATRVRGFEYLPVFLEEKPRRPPRAKALRTNANDSNATRIIKDAIRKQDGAKEEGGPEYADVVQLVNYDPFSYSSLEGAEMVASQALRTYWKHLAKETARGGSIEEDLFDESGTGSASMSFFLPEPSSSSSNPPASLEAVETTEYEVWRSLDEMIRLLSMAASATVPLPSQLLGLLPKRDDWPREFALEDYAKSLSTSGSSSVGTAFKSPFVRVDAVVASSDPSSYSYVRRARRLSYAIWSLLDGLAVSGARPSAPPRHEVLNMRSVGERLSAAKRTLEGINFVLKKMLPENRKDGE